MNLLKESKIDFDNYKKTNQIKYFKQSVSKINLLVVKNTNDRLLLAKCSILKNLYHANSLRGEAWEFEEIYLEIYKIMKVGLINGKTK